jgi:hypothetical protein
MSRDSHLDKVPGFVEFHLLRGPEAEDHTLATASGIQQIDRFLSRLKAGDEISGQRDQFRRTVDRRSENSRCRYLF